ncbi:MAG: AsmA family protein [Rhodospirillaceae bacterium]|jgi:uncharacterized protein involved in outer membrane biogenesis|nr:AsmA family protein [Rhodospirillaceae bacterium]
MRLRTIFIGIAVILVALVVTAVAILMSIDFNQYKSLVADKVKAATGRELVIAGDFSLALSLTPAVEVHDVTFANAPGGSRPVMASLKRLEVQIELVPLLTSRLIKIDRLILDGADILLETDAKGRGNWIFQPSGGEKSAAGATPSTPSNGGPALVPQVSVVQIKNSTVTYRDARTGVMRSFKVDKLDAKTDNGHLNLDLAAVVGQAPLHVSGSVGSPDLLAGGAPYPIDLTVTSGDTSATVKGQVAQIATVQGVALDITAKGKALSDLNAATAVPLPPLGPYSFAGKVVDVPDGYKVSGLQLTMGDSGLTGEASIFLNGKRPKIAGNFAATKIDLKDFGIRPGSGQRGGAGDGRVFPATPLPFGALSLMDADINFTAQQMIKAPVSMQNVRLAMTLADGRLQVKPFEAALAGGTVRVGLSVDGVKTPAPVSLDVTEQNAEAGSLLQVLVGSSVLSGGRANLKLTVNGAGNSVRAIVAGLNGKLDYTMGPGNINNDFAKLILADLFKLLSFGGGGDSSNLKCLVARFDINRGLATTRQLVTDTSGATIVGKGTINLATEGLDLHLVPYATATNLANLAIPMIVGGTMASPHVVPDAEAMATGAIGMVANAPVNVLNTLGNVAGIGELGGGSGGEPAAGCGAAAASAKQGAKQPSTQQGGSGEGLLNGVGGAAKGATDAIKGLLP